LQAMLESGSSNDTDCALQSKSIKTNSHQQSLCIIVDFLKTFTDNTYELRLDRNTLYIHHNSKIAREMLLHEMTLSAIYGITHTYQIGTIKIEGYPAINIETVLKYVKNSVQLR